MPENFEGELWKDIPGYEGFYEASSFGRIRSKERTVRNYYCRERILMQSVKHHYLYVTLSKDGKTKNIRVHRLIAITFLPNPKHLSDVNHKDENPLNNKVDNLEWCSNSYNLQYGTRIERGQETRRRKKDGIVENGVSSKQQEDTVFDLPFNNLEGEEWRPVSGYEGLYEISNYGRLKSLHHKIPYIVRANTVKSGRMNAHLHRNGKDRSIGVHVLVAKAFIPNPNNFKEINHKDENPLNNHVNNLEWCSHNYNMHYGTLCQRLSIIQKNHPSTSKPVAQYSLEGIFIKTWPSIREIKRSLNAAGWKNISYVCRGKLHSALGYQWRYVEKGKVPERNIGPCARRCSTAPKMVYQYTTDKVFVRSYDSVTAAGLSVKISGTNISACIKGKQKSAAGFLWFDKRI